MGQRKRSHQSQNSNILNSGGKKAKLGLLSSEAMPGRVLTWSAHTIDYLGSGHMYISRLFLPSDFPFCHFNMFMMGPGTKAVSGKHVQ